MDYSKSALIHLAIERGILRFGQFTLKSGRLSPYFFNTGLFYHGDSLRFLGRHYAEILIKNNIEFEHLFGPAYKGIPLVIATAIALDERGVNRTVTFDRKEEKGHGEGGLLVGAPLTGRTVLVDDVISAGTTSRTAQQLISDHGGTLTTIVITLDRCEHGLNNQLTRHEIKSTGINILSLITVYDLIHYLEEQNDQETITKMKNYLSQHGDKA
ncbi:MAG: orotate phosphoribosyltransferase [Legionellales bacterium RIFCSPHIGHO2_12_FULL_42_9]|nr:MAG: orotate phosphoribosyltransferase [Legionellales bacterium RIFCSPHIGHO2_12_FULL_42_9]